MMNTYVTFVKAHGGFAMLLDLLALACFVLALVTLVAGHKQGLLKLAQKLTLAQSIVGGLLAISGLIVLFWGNWGFQSLWVWSGLVLVVLYPVLSVRVTKPALAAVVDGAAAGKWLAMTLVHLVMLLAVHALMVLKSI